MNGLRVDGSILSSRQIISVVRALGVPKSSLSGLEKFEAPDLTEWCPRGCTVVNFDARGCFDSEGGIFFLGTQEARDGHDTIAWAAEQSWCDGNVALVGNSWLAVSQW